MLIVYHSNRLERLFTAFCDLVARPLADPMQPEIVVVQSQGMSRWLSLQYAEAMGICANLRFPFPAALVGELFEAMEHEPGAGAPFNGDALVWSIMAQLDPPAEGLEDDTLRRYLQADDLPIRRYRLAAEIAKVFDQYLVYRPDWIRKWETGNDADWQAGLWRQLVAAHGNRHRATLLFDLLARLDGALIRRAGLPRRISLFGIATLPRALFEVIVALARHIEVHLFLLSPCQAFWDDIVSEKRLARLVVGQADAVVDQQQHYYETGNELLAMLGTQGQDFQRLLHQYDFDEIDCFAPPAQTFLLGRIQGDILQAVESSAVEPGMPGAFALEPTDRSIQVHSAHSAMREVEILHDQLLEMFSRDVTLEPGDVLVMTPDINRYAPYIEAVFGSVGGTGARMPFSIADRKLSEASPLVRVFLELLRLPASRLGAGQLLALLDAAPIRNRFKIKADEMVTLTTWVQHTSIRWGVDEVHRDAMGLPSTRQGTWQHGVDRMLLGLALSGHQDRLFVDLLPYEDIEGSDVDLLDRFLHLLDAVFDLMGRGRQSRSPAAWATELNRLIDLFLVVDQSQEAELQMLRIGLDRMARDAAVAGFNGSIDLAVVAAHLEMFFARDSGPGHFLAGRVTCCQMVPMRSIPRRVICLLGLEDDAFPRLDRPLDFDLMANDFRIGDRCRRGDDRYLFLEAMLSARACLYISYVGRGVRDNEVRPPSVMVDALLQAIGRATGLNRQQTLARFVTQHPLQPFSQQYFSEQPGLFTYNTEAGRIAACLARQTPWPGLLADCGAETTTTTTTDTEISERTLEWSGFVRFFQHPIRTLLQQRFGLYLDDRQDEVVEREPFALDHLERYKLCGALIESQLADADMQGNEAIFRADGRLPDGVAGQLTFQHSADRAAAMVERLQRLQRGTSATDEPLALEVDLSLNGLQLIGHLQVWPSGQYLYRHGTLGSMKYQDTVRHWLCHLLLNAMAPASICCQTTFVCRDGLYRYDPIDDAVERLALLVDWYVKGQAKPLLLLPRTSFAYGVHLWGKTKPGAVPLREAAMARATEVWHHGAYGIGPSEPEKNDPYFRHALGDRDPLLEPMFQAAAEMLLAPALAGRHRESP